jgi:type IV secretory pathway VirB10-like protein
MSFDQTPFKTFDTERNARLAAGLASPLWAPFFAAAGAGLAFWWMTVGVRRQLEAAPSFAAAETKSFAPVPVDPASPADAVEAAAPAAKAEPAEPVAANAPALPVSEAPVERAQAAAEDGLHEAGPDSDLDAAEEALADTQAEVAQLAAEAATAGLAAKPRSRKKG